MQNETSISVAPWDGSILLGAWNDASERYYDTNQALGLGAFGIGFAISRDAGATWERLDTAFDPCTTSCNPESTCDPLVETCCFETGHAFTRPADMCDDTVPWLAHFEADPATAIGGNGYVYLVGLTQPFMSRLQWTNPTAGWVNTLVPVGTLGGMVDKPFVSADPDPAYDTVYVHWATLDTSTGLGITLLSASQNAGDTFPPTETGLRLSFRETPPLCGKNFCTWGTASVVGPGPNQERFVHIIWRHWGGVNPSDPADEHIDQIRYRRGEWVNGDLQFKPPLPPSQSNTCDDGDDCAEGIIFDHPEPPSLVEHFDEGFRRTLDHLSKGAAHLGRPTPNSSRQGPTGHPSIAVDPNPPDHCTRGGNIYVAYTAEAWPGNCTGCTSFSDLGCTSPVLDRRVDTNVYVVRGKVGFDDEVVWSQPVCLTCETGTCAEENCEQCNDLVGITCGQHYPLQFFPWVAVDALGRVGVAYYDTTVDPNRCDINVEYQIKFTYSLDGGITWEAPITVSDPGVISQTGADPDDPILGGLLIFVGDYSGLTAAGDGEFHPLWMDLRDWDGRYRTIKPGDIYTDLITVSDPIIAMGDYDKNGAVDQADLAVLVNNCMCSTDLACEIFDFDRDGKITTIDQCLFHDCATAALTDPRPPCWVSDCVVDCTVCIKTSDCADTDENGIRDDVCMWWECCGTCMGTATAHPSDMGSPLGVCEPDTFCNLSDFLLALTCFAGTSMCDSINIDAGGPLGSCAPDGFCNLADGLHALTCLQGANPCTCGESAQGSGPPEVVGATSLRVVRAPLVTESDTITVRVFTETALDDLQSYQLELRVSGGTSGQFELLDIFIEPRSDYVFAGVEDNFTAFNVSTGQMLSGGSDIGAGVRTRPHAYLATYTYRASATATGEFVVDIPHDLSIGDQTFLVASFNRTIEVTDSTPAVVTTTP